MKEKLSTNLETMNRPNLIYILADDMGVGDVSYLSDHCKFSTPNLDRLGREGLCFTDAHSSSSVCTPSRYSILTGRYCWRTYLKQGVLFGGSSALLDDRISTFPKLAKKRGYKTACVGKWHVGWDWAPKEGFENLSEESKTKETEWIDFSRPIKNGPQQAGFDHFYGICGSLDMPPYVYIKDDIPVEIPTEWGTQEEFGRPGPRMESLRANNVLEHITSKAVQFVEEQKSDSPFFLYFPITAPHTPIAPAEEFLGKSGIGDYGDFCVEIDHRVGQILDALERCGLEDDTMVIFTTDNGASRACSPEELKEAYDHRCSHIYRGYKSDIWDGGHRIPFMVRWPKGISPSTYCHDPIGIFDTIATFADLWGMTLKKDEAPDAFSFSKSFTGESLQERLLVHHSIDGQFSIRKGDWKLCRCPGSGGWSSPGDSVARKKGHPEVQLYNLSEDVGEQTNLAEHYPQKVQEMTEELHALVIRDNPGLEPWIQINWLPEIPDLYITDD